MCDKHDRAITFLVQIQLTSMFSGPLQKDLLKGK